MQKKPYSKQQRVYFLDKAIKRRQRERAEAYDSPTRSMIEVEVKLLSELKEEIELEIRREERGDVPVVQGSIFG